MKRLQNDKSGTATIERKYYMLPATVGQSANNWSGIANVVRTFPVQLREGMFVDEIQWRNNTNAASNFASVGIYDLNGNLLVDSGPQSTAGAGQRRVALTTPVFLPAGMYIAAYTATTTNTTQFATFASGTGIDTLYNAFNNYLGTAANSATAGQLPATLGTITSALVNQCIIILYGK
jgi:hypothetical protein